MPETSVRRDGAKSVAEAAGSGPGRATGPGARPGAGARADTTRPVPSWLPLGCLLLVGLLLGLNATLVKLGIAAGWPPLAFLFWGVLGGGVLLLGTSIAMGERPGVRPQDFVYYLIAALISMALPNALAYSAVPHVGAGFVSLCMAFPPLFTYVFALGLRMETLRIVRGVGIVLGLVGALLLTLGKTGQGSVEPWWMAAAMIGPIFLAMGNIYRTRWWPKGASPMSLAPGMLLGGALLVLPCAILTGTPVFDLPWQGPGTWIVIIQMVTFATTYALYFVLQKIAGPVYMSQIGSIGAVSGAAIAVFFLGEQANLLLVLAAVVVLAGVVLVSRKPS